MELSYKVVENKMSIKSVIYATSVKSHFQLTFHTDNYGYVRRWIDNFSDSRIMLKTYYNTILVAYWLYYLTHNDRADFFTECFHFTDVMLTRLPNDRLEITDPFSLPVESDGSQDYD